MMRLFLPYTIRLLLVTLFCFLASGNIKAEVIPADADTDYILLINPDAETCAWSAMYIPHIVADMAEKYPDLPVYVEHMLALSLTGTDDLVAFQEQLFAKYPKAPAYIIMLEADTYSVMHEAIDARWGEDIPTLLFARNDYFGPIDAYITRKDIHRVNRIPLEPIVRERDNLTVVYHPFYIKETLALMKSLLPHLNKLIFISDTRYISAQNRADLEEVVRDSYPDLTVEHLISDDLSTDEMVSLLSREPKESGLLFFAWYNASSSDDESDIFLQTNAYRIFYLYANSPFFTLNDVGVLESGMVGGYYTHFEQVYTTVMQALDGMIAGEVHTAFIVPPAPHPTFNYLAMLSGGLSLSQLPADAHIYMRPQTFWEKNSTLFVIVLLLMALTGAVVYFFSRRTHRIETRETKLRASYSDLINNMPIGYRQERLIFDAKGEPVDYVVSAVNPSYEEQLSPREEIVGKKGSLANPEMFSEMLNIYKSILHDKHTRVNMAYYFDATDRYFSLIISPSSDPGYMDLFYVDTSELHKTQQLLRTVNSKLMMSLDVANITPWKWDMERRLILCDVNKPIERYAEGIREEEQLCIPEERYFSRIHEDDIELVQKTLKELIENMTYNHTAKCEFRIYKTMAKTSYDWVEVRGAIEKRSENGKATSLLGTSVIITDRKNIEQELLHAKEKAEESNRLKSAFLANMSHEIRTPLNAIVGFSNILAATEKDEDRQEYISIIENNNTLLLQLVSDILDLSKIEAGTMDFHYSDVDLNFILYDLQEVTQDRAKKEVKVEFDNMIPNCFIRTEKKRITQVLNNMLSNAAKFTDSGSIRFGYKLIEGGKLYFYVSDTGCGISPEQQEKIFGRFVKLNHFVQGTGLGLSLCQMIVMHMGGTIGVQPNEEGQGTTFWFTLPYVPVAHAENILEAAKEEEVKSDKLKVLIAEDNQSNFELFEAILRNDYEIIHAWNGKEAVDMFREHTPHIVLMDINMPKMNGYEATVELRKISQEVPIIAVTAYAFSTDEKQIRRNGFNGYSPKPLNPQKLKLQMTELLKSQAGII
ncbi:response regulator [Parabacteroides sp. OttesenSCG-928-B22]|nr:response regulator [Parabacteroides sp. OttesenSCG-928-B22]